MIIHIKKEINPDIFQADNWPMFDKKKALQFVMPVPDLALVSFSIEQMDDLYLLDIFFEQLGEQFFEADDLSENYKMWMFIAHSSWQPKSTIVLYKKLWKSLSDARFLEFNNKKECLVESPQGVRFAGITEVTLQNFGLAIKISKDYSCFLILSPRNIQMDTADMHLLFHAAFPKYKGLEQSAVDLLSLSVQLCPRGCIVIRPAAEHNSKNLFVDCVMQTANLPIFA